jgi:hypothetical protein
MTYRIAALIFTSLLLVACSRSDNQPAPKIFKEEIDALDKAKAVGPALQKLDEEQRKTVEQQSQ